MYLGAQKVKNKTGAWTHPMGSQHDGLYHPFQLMLVHYLNGLMTDKPKITAMVNNTLQ